MGELEAFLRRMAAGDVPDRDMGICGNLIHTFNFGSLNVCNLFMHWPESCGDHAFPIAGGDEYLFTGDKWTGENGEKRKRLCTWMADLLALKDAG